MFNMKSRKHSHVENPADVSNGYAHATKFWHFLCTYGTVYQWLTFLELKCSESIDL